MDTVITINDNRTTLEEGIMSQAIVCGMDYEDFLIRMEEFHGTRSPGMVVGGVMLDVGLQKLGNVRFLNVVCETVVCLPDAVQLLTPCTTGNGFLQILDWGKFALTAYDRKGLSGIRTWINPTKLSNYPLVQEWFQRTGSPREKPPFEQLAKEILTAKSQLISHKLVRLYRALKSSKPIPTGLCPQCGESYRMDLGETCPVCHGDSYYY
jgi:formylmethanofuran dehydrogenase subunit E